MLVKWLPGDNVYDNHKFDPRPQLPIYGNDHETSVKFPNVLEP